MHEDGELWCRVPRYNPERIPTTPKTIQYLLFLQLILGRPKADASLPCACSKMSAAKHWQPWHFKTVLRAKRGGSDPDEEWPCWLRQHKIWHSKLAPKASCTRPLGRALQRDN